MITLVLIGIVCMALGMLIARMSPVDKVTDYLADKLYDYLDRKTTVDNARVSVGQGFIYDRSKEELSTR